MIAARALQVKAVIPFQFVALPSEILRRVDVSDAAKLLVAVILDAARGSRSVCRLTNAALAARLGKSVAAVKRPLAELESLGLIRRDTLAGGRVQDGHRADLGGAGRRHCTCARSADRCHTLHARFHAWNVPVHYSDSHVRTSFSDGTDFPGLRGEDGTKTNGGRSGDGHTGHGRGQAW